MSLNESYDRDNIFAKIIRGEMPCAKIHETDDALIFMDAFPQSRGHMLIISKTATAVNLLDVDVDTLSKLISLTQHAARAAVKALGADGFKVVQYNGTLGGQTVFHLHFHVIPVFEGETIGAHGIGMADMKDLETMAEKIREQF